MRGGVTAGLLFILPGAVAILGLSWLYVLLGNFTLVEGLFFGLKAAVLAIVVQAMIRIAGRTLKGVLKPILAIAGFVALFAFGLPFPLVVLGAGLIGYIAVRWFSSAEAAATPESDSVSSIYDLTINRSGTMRAAIICLLLWLVTVGGLFMLLGADNVFTQIATFFSKLAVVTFGGAYAVLSYVAQQGVEQFQWLQPGEMLDGLGLAETTPGPLILVTQFVGFLAGLRQSGLEPTMLYATLGALLTTWVTFLPCFLWIFAGAPYVEKLRDNKALSMALAAITAAVVGVIANLALWFALNLLFSENVRITSAGLDMLLPLPATIDIAMLSLTVLAFVMVFGFKMRISGVLAISAAAGMAVKAYTIL